VDFFALLKPLEWVVANIMVLFHQFFEWIGLDPAGGLAWSLSIVGLVVTIRIILIPLFVKQIKASRAMQVIAPELRAVQEKYKGKKDQASREAMSRETMALYAKHKTNPFASCLPILVQAPIFFALFRVLNYRLEGQGEDLAIGLLTDELRAQASEATILGAKLSETFLVSEGGSAKIVAAILIVAMVATSFLTQRQLTRKNMPQSALEGPMARQQQMIMYAMPFVFVISGPYFPIGVLIYWTTTNVWTMGQQFYVIRRNPTPGSEAEKALLDRKKEKAARKGLTIDGIPLSEVVEPEKPSGQRQQPKRKDRNKPGAKPAAGATGVAGAEALDVDGDGKPDDPVGIST
jgi:YidC/Oxa1 family membrane protein insertase